MDAVFLENTGFEIVGSWNIFPLVVFQKVALIIFLKNFH